MAKNIKNLYLEIVQNYKIVFNCLYQLQNIVKLKSIFLECGAQPIHMFVMITNLLEQKIVSTFDETRKQIQMCSVKKCVCMFVIIYYLL